MMFLYKDFGRKNNLVSLFTLSLFFLIAGVKNLKASECFLKLQHNKSLGTTIVHNDCKKDNELSLNAILEIREDTRLWLESKNIHDNTKNYWLICHNLSSSPIRVIVDSTILPWIIHDSTSKCSRSFNRMECFDAKKGDQILLCESAKISRKLPEKEPTTSVLVRNNTKDSLLPEDQHNINHLKVFLEPRINLCRSVLPEKKPIKLTFVIKPSGEINHVIVTTGKSQKQFDDCIVEAVKDSFFPLFEEDMQVSITYE